MRFHCLKFLLAPEFIFEMEMRHKLWSGRSLDVWVGGVGWRTDKVFQQLPHLPPAITLFNTTASLCVGERTGPPDVGIVERCEPPAVKLPAGGL